MSPGYPQPYESGRQCTYEIEADVGKAIVLDFIDFDIEDTSYPDCDFDYLKVYHLPTCFYFYFRFSSLVR